MATKVERGIKASESGDPLDSYILQHSLRLTPVQKELIEYTNTLPGRFFCHTNFESPTFLLYIGYLPLMIGSPDEAQFFQLILQLTGAKRCSTIFF